MRINTGYLDDKIVYSLATRTAKAVRVLVDARLEHSETTLPVLAMAYETLGKASDELRLAKRALAAAAQNSPRAGRVTVLNAAGDTIEVFTRAETTKWDRDAVIDALVADATNECGVIDGERLANNFRRVSGTVFRVGGLDQALGKGPADDLQLRTVGERVPVVKVVRAAEAESLEVPASQSPARAQGGENPWGDDAGTFPTQASVRTASQTRNS